MDFFRYLQPLNKLEPFSTSQIVTGKDQPLLILAMGETRSEV